MSRGALTFLYCLVFLANCYSVGNLLAHRHFALAGATVGFAILTLAVLVLPMVGAA